MKSSNCSVGYRHPYSISVASNRRNGLTANWKEKQIEFLDKKVQTKDEFLTELMAEHMA